MCQIPHYTANNETDQPIGRDKLSEFLSVERKTAEEIG